jgi:acyl-CoA thioester hydrolase
MTRRRKSDAAPAAPAAKAPRRRRGTAAAQADAPAAPASEAVAPAPAPAPTPSPVPAPAPRRLLRMALPVRWRDLDAFSHVNNSTFLTYIEEARLQWFQSLPGPWLSEDAAPVLAATHVNYRRPIEWPADLAVELYAERVGNTSLTVAHRILRADDETVLYSDGHSVLVWIDRQGRPAPLPAAVRTAASG